MSRKKKSMRVGGGGRFQKGEQAMERKGMGRKEAGAIMAKEGRKKYGKKAFARMGAVGRKRKRTAKGR